MNFWLNLLPNSGQELMQPTCPLFGGSTVYRSLKCQTLQCEWTVVIINNVGSTHYKFILWMQNYVKVSH